MELIILILLLVVLARLPKKKSSGADTGIVLPALRMGVAVLVAVFVGLLAMQLL